MVLRREQVERIVATANQNIAQGVIKEPRILFDEIQVPTDGTIQFGTSDAFRNGEEYPLQIRWMTLGLRWLDVDNEPLTDERLIQTVRLRFTFHGQDYMRRVFLPAPVWHDKPVAAGTALLDGQSSFRFADPFILSARDAMRVKVMLDEAPGASPPETRTFVVSFNGFGLASQRPYFRAAEVALSDTSQTELDAALFTNDGDEPIVMTDMAVYISATSLDTNPTGNIRIGRLQVQQLGNGTQADWVQGPSTGPSGTGAGADLCPAILFGVESGRALVHCWPPRVDSPDGGIYWEPGEGIQLEVQSLPPPGEAPPTPVIAVALIGTIIVS